MEFLQRYNLAVSIYFNWKMNKNQVTISNKISVPGVILGSVVIGGGLLLFLMLLINWNRPPQKQTGRVTAALTVIAAPTATLTEIPSSDEFPKSTSDAGLHPIEDLRIGSFVKVSGTEGAGLRLRSNPGLDSEPLYLGLEDEIFKIEDGPVELDGYQWWYLAAPFDSSRNGWAVSIYLQTDQVTE